MMSVRRLMEAARKEGLKGEEMQRYLEENKDELGGDVTMDDFEKSLKKVGRSVGGADLEKYQKWFEEYGAA